MSPAFLLHGLASELLTGVGFAFLHEGGLGGTGQRLAVLAHGLGFAGRSCAAGCRTSLGIRFAFLHECSLGSAGQRLACLAHGFGFAADLLEMKLPVTRLAELLVGFNLGVEIGQLTLVLGVTAAVLVLSRLKLTLPRPLVVDVAGSALVAIGTYWFVSRSFA